MFRYDFLKEYAVSGRHYDDETEQNDIIHNYNSGRRKNTSDVADILETTKYPSVLLNGSRIHRNLYHPRFHSAIATNENSNQQSLIGVIVSGANKANLDAALEHSNMNENGYSALMKSDAEHVRYAVLNHTKNTKHFDNAIMHDPSDLVKMRAALFHPNGISKEQEEHLLNSDNVNVRRAALEAKKSYNNN
jgi:hypothetical protein